MEGERKRKLAYALGAILAAVTAVNVAVAVFADGSLSVTEFKTSAFGDPYVETEYTVFIESRVPFPTIAAFTYGGSLIETAPPSFELGLNASGDNLTVTFAESSFNRSNTVRIIMLDLVVPDYSGVRLGGREAGTFEVAVNATDAGVLQLPIQAGDSFTLFNVSRQDAYDLEWEGPHPSPDHDRQSVVIATFRSVNGTWTVETCPNHEFEC